MSGQVDFYYDFGSPTAYLAWTQLPAICASKGAQINYHPVLLGGIFKAVDSHTPVNVKPKGAWIFDDVRRHAKRYGVPFAMNPHFIVNTLTIMRGAIWAKDEGVIEPYNKAMFEAMWVGERNMAEPQEIMDVLANAGLDSDAAAEAVQNTDVKQALIAATGAAVERGLFGVPTMIIGDELHFGQDRLDWVAEALDRA